MTLSTQSDHVSSESSSLFAAFSNELFVARHAWNRVESILDANRGGNYGITGPRGAGKTWLMTAAVNYARFNNGLGLWYPSPSEYDPKAFLAALSEVFAQEYVRDYFDRSPYSTELRYRGMILLLRSIRLFLFYAGLILLLIGIIRGVGPYLRDLSARYLPFVDVIAFLGILLIFASYILTRFFRIRVGSKDSLQDLYDKAVELRRKARFTTAYKEATEASASAGAKGISGILKRSVETDLSERPATVSSIIHDFRSFAGDVATALRGPIVIAIDELDKMATATAVADLLRDTKGIFDVPGVHFFVSISDEAARYLDLGAIQQRNEFNSSFYQVFELKSLSPEQCAEMLRRRIAGLNDDMIFRLSILAGGVPREVIRLADMAINPEHGPQITTSPALEVALLKQELAAFQYEVESATDQADKSSITDEDKLQSRLIGQLASDPKRFVGTDFLTPDLWSPSWASPQWMERFGEYWRRLLVRHATAVELANSPSAIDIGRITQLQEIVSRTALSAVIGRALLEEYTASRLAKGMPKTDSV